MKTVYTSSCSHHPRQNYNKASNCLSCICKNKGREEKSEWIYTLGTSYLGRPMCICAMISHKENWSHCRFWKSIFTSWASWNWSRCHKILMTQRHLQTGNKRKYRNLHKTSNWNHLESIFAWGYCSTPLRRKNSLIAENIKDNIYAGDVITVVENTNEAIEFYNKSKKMFKDASLNLKDWINNLQEVNDPTT